VDTRPARSGRIWGDARQVREAAARDGDLAEYIRHSKAGGYPVATVVESRCGECDGRAFRVNLDVQEATQRLCLACDATAFIGYSAEHWSGTGHDSYACPCGGVESATRSSTTVRCAGSVSAYVA